MLVYNPGNVSAPLVLFSTSMMINMLRQTGKRELSQIRYLYVFSHICVFNIYIYTYIFVWTSTTCMYIYIYVKTVCNMFFGVKSILSKCM